MGDPFYTLWGYCFFAYNIYPLGVFVKALKKEFGDDAKICEND